jgi:hypothetical protein
MVRYHSQPIESGWTVPLEVLEERKGTWAMPSKQWPPLIRRIIYGNSTAASNLKHIQKIKDLRTKRKRLKKKKLGYLIYYSIFNCYYTRKYIYPKMNIFVFLFRNMNLKIQPDATQKATNKSHLSALVQ